MQVKCKNGTTPDSLILLCAIFNAFVAWHDVDNIHAANGDAPETLLITAGRNGKHMPGSRHYTDQALDIRSHTFTDKLQFVAAVIARLGEAEACVTRTGEGFRTKDQQWLGILEGAGTPNEHFHFERN